MSLPRFMMTTRKRKTCKKKFFTQSSQGDYRGGQEMFTGVLAPVGPRVEPPLAVALCFVVCSASDSLEKSRELMFKCTVLNVHCIIY